MNPTKTALELAREYWEAAELAGNEAALAERAALVAREQATRTTDDVLVYAHTGIAESNERYAAELRAFETRSRAEADRCSALARRGAAA